MATLEELVVSLTAETSSLKAEMQSASKAVQTNTEKMEQAVAEFSKSSTKNVGFFESAMSTMAGVLGSQLVIGAFGMVKDGAAALAGEFMKGVDSANAEELALTKLANSLALSGNYTTEAMKSLADFTGEMESLTNIGDDVVAANLSILSSLTKLDAEGLKSAQRSAIDLSSAIGIDLESATRLVAKGVNGNTEAFKRYGIEVQEGANKSERLANIMSALSSTQGSAAGATKTFDGTLTKMSNTWGNLVEGIATAVTKNEAVMGVLGMLSGMLDAVTADVQGNNDAYKKLVGEGLVMLLDGTAMVVTGLDAMIRIVETLFRDVQTVVNGVGYAVTSLAGVFSETASVAAETFKEGMVDSAKKAEEALNGESLLGSLSTKLLELKGAAETGLGSMKSSAESVVAPTVAATEAVAQLSAAQTQYNEKIAEQAKALADEGASLEAGYTFQQEMLKNNLEAKLITGQEYHALEAEALAARQAEEQMQVDQAYANKSISDQQYYDAKLALARKQATETSKLAADTTKFEQEQGKLRAANLSSTLGVIASLSQSSSKELASIGKAAAISTATIDGYAAVQKALASAPPPFNFALAAAVGMATAANVAKIAGVGLNKGIDSVPGIGSGDSVPAVLTPGERVVPQKTNEDLTNFLQEARSGGLGGGGTVEVIISMKEELMDFIEAQLVERGRLGTSLQGA